MRLIPFFVPMLASLSLVAADFPLPDALPERPALPDPLVAEDGTAITSPDQWNSRRRPELRRLFEHYMYGRWPSGAGWKNQEVLQTDENALEGKAVLREYSVRVGLAAPVHLLVVTPKNPAKPVPCFLGLNFNGNHQVLPHPAIALPTGWVRAGRDGQAANSAREADRGKEREAWSVAKIIERGYGFATFYQGDLVPDEPALAAVALRQLDPATNVEAGNADDASGTGTIAAWAWGFSQMLNALEKVPEIDATRVAAVGHSRNGKTALLAAAFDTRFAMAIPSQAGSGGTGPSRVAPDMAELKPNGRPTAETVAVITKNFPHWFCRNFSKFGAMPQRLPFDQHALIALCAPRPVLISNATEDLWANPSGQFEMLRAAAPVFVLLAGTADDLAPAAMPEVGQLVPSRLAYFIRPGKHSMAPEDWSAWLDYADRWLK